MSARTVILTGGTAGIGEALARRLRLAGDRVVVIGRRATTGRDNRAVDLRNPNAQTEVVDGLQRLDVPAWDVLIHCAGLGWVGAFPMQRCEGIRDLLHGNVWAPLALTRNLLASAASSARVVFVSSPAAHWPSPDYAVYAASKAALEAFARALRAERIGNVSIQVVRPGATVSGMLNTETAARLGIDATRLTSADDTAARIARTLDGPAGRWRGTDLASSLAAPLRRWAGARLLARPPKIAWPAPVFGEGQKGRPHTALITGVAEGIGRALAVRFAAAGFQVVAVDRNEEGLVAADQIVKEHGGSLLSVVADLGDADGLRRLADRLQSRGPFDVVVHNAGLNRFGRFPTVELDEQRSVFAVNLVAPIVLTRELFARRMLSAGCRLGFVSSLSHFVGYPGAAVYASTKSGLASFAESLAAVGKRYGFSVTTVFPGPTRTRHAYENSPDNRREHRRTEPRVLADAICRGMLKRRAVVIHGVSNRLAAAIGRRFPRMTEAMMRRALLGGAGANVAGAP